MISPEMFDLQARNLLMIDKQLDILKSQVAVALNGLELLRPLVDKNAGKPQEEKQRVVKTLGGGARVVPSPEAELSPDDAASLATRQRDSYIDQGQGTGSSTDKDAVASSPEVKD